MANNRRLAQVGSFVGSTSSDKLAFTANTGIGTTNPRFTLEVGAVGASGTSLFVNGDAFVSGALTATSFFGSVTGDITGNADTATALQTAREFSVSGDASTASAVSFDGTGNVGLAITLSNTGVAPGSYGASNLIPRITVDAAGRITSAAQNAFAIIQDTSPELGGNLNLNSRNVTGTGNFNVSGIITATTFSGSGANLTNIPTTGLTTNTVSYGGVTLTLGGSDATPAFDLADATNYPLSSLTGAGSGVLTFLATPSSANLASAVTDETGSGSLVFATSPTLVTPVLGRASATSINSSGIITASSFVKTGGTSSQFLKADGTVDSSTYLTSALQNVVEDTTPQLGGNLDLNSKNITGTGNVSITGGVSASGVITATSGFNLGISSAGTSITSGSPVTTLNFIGAGNTFAFNGTTVDISIAGGGGGGGGVSEVETTVSTTSATGVGSFAVATYRSADVIAQISQGSSYQVGRYLMIHDGTTVTVVEESSVATGSMLGSFDGVVNGSNAELRVTLVSAGTAATVTTKIDTVTIP